jgi:hypothetical protein
MPTELEILITLLNEVSRQSGPFQSLIHDLCPGCHKRSRDPSRVYDPAKR